jgi:gliding motility-associated-like protein
MKKMMTSFLFFITIRLFAQCPVSVSITPSLVNPLCKNTTVTLTANSTNGGITPQFLWVLDGDTFSGGLTFTTAVNFAEVEVILISSNGCPQDTATNNYSVVNTTLIAAYNIADLIECNQPLNDVEILEITGDPGDSSPYSYGLITLGGSLGQKSIYSALQISSYPIAISDANGCLDTTWIDMTTLECPDPIVSEMITPNDDGKNDVLFINNLNYYPKNEIYIFDRWGQRVYHKKNYDNLNGWKAKYVGVDLPVSTYYYVLKINLGESKDLTYKGAISVFR